jgi:hypothetical protein
MFESLTSNQNTNSTVLTEKVSEKTFGISLVVVSWKKEKKN